MARTEFLLSSCTCVEAIYGRTTVVAGHSGQSQDVEHPVMTTASATRLRQDLIENFITSPQDKVGAIMLPVKIMSHQMAMRKRSFFAKTVVKKIPSRLIARETREVR